ncbi:MAG: T9SS type A sorting domain-containing protein [Bacteroidales bacterium]|nr:T9SS type A sorting domain-containing protein [Bacteroidales bacterium]
MKKFGLLTAAFLMIGLLFGTQVMAQHIELGVTKSAQTCANVTDEGFTASFSFSSIDASEISTEKGMFSTLTMNGTYPSGNVGEPMLPAVNKLIAVPFGAKIDALEVKSYTTTTYSLADFGINKITPMQPRIRKDQKPEDVPFAYNEKAYATKGFVERPIAMAEIKGTMRGIQIGALTINPVQYDAATNRIRVYNNIEIEVRYSQYDKSASYDEFARTFSPYFANIYSQMFNWRDDVYDEHPDLWQSPVKMLVIADRMFEECLQPWYTWKTTKGFYLSINYTDEIGTSAAAIRAFIQEEYGKDAPTFLMIMGDKNQVAASATGSETHCVTDLQYSSVDGDEFPDMYHSRFPAETVAQMQAMINKALEYEQYTMPDPSYLNNVLLIAGEDSGWGVTVGRPTIWYATNYYFNAEHGFDQVHEYSHGQYSGCYSWLNEGVGFANYTAHGSNTSWAGPQFTVSDVNNLTNEHKYFLAMGNCCEAADWGINGTCFGEAMVRAENKAAYAYIGSCPSTYWLNDYYFGVGGTSRHDGTMPTYEETTMGFYDAMWTDNAYNTVTSMMFIGNLASNAAQALGYELHCSTLYDWQAYHTLGDGSVMPFRVQPIENTVSHMAIFPIGMPTYEVSADPGSYVAISKDGVLHGVGLIDESGVINVEVDPITSGGDVTICVTHPQRIPYINTVPAAAMEGPYISVDSYTPANVHVGHESSMSITFKNVGTSATDGTTTVSLSCNDDNLTILDGTASFESLAPETTVQVGGFRYIIAEGVADGTRFIINTTAVCGSNTWEGRATITAGEAVLQFDGMANPGGFVPGETISIIASFKNTGHYKATNAIATVTSTSPYVSFVNDSFEVGTLDPTGIAYCVFNVTIDANCPVTEQLPLTITLNADGGLTAEGSGIIKNSCNVIFELTDSWGDGWNGNYLNVSFSDGTPSQNLTIENGNSETYVIEIGHGVHVTLSWISGQYTYECSFVVRYEDGDEICQATSPNTNYSFEFDCNCSAGAPVGTFNPVEDLQAEATETGVTLAWNAPEGAINYIIYRNGIEIAQTSETTYTDNIISKDGFYTYCVVAEYAEGASVPDCVIIEFLDAISENEAEFAIYPNPVNNTLFVNCGNAEFNYEMFNGMGQKVASGNATGNAQISVNDMTKGIYFLRLTSGTQVRMEKVVVE